MNWTLFDYVFMGGMITVAATIIILLRRASNSGFYRAGVAIGTLGGFLMVWANGAVGIIGNENNAANLMFFGVLGVAGLGAVIARFRARGMSLAFYATLIAQLVVGAYAYVMDLGSTDPSWPTDIILATGFFGLFWLVSAALFQKAARSQRRLFVD